MQGYHVVNGLDCLGPVLETWVQVVGDMVIEWSRKGYNDVPWVHSSLLMNGRRSDKERLCVSLLAGAIWRLDGICLEEYPDWKKEDRSSYSGRVDLYFTVRDVEFTAEAKSVWSDLGQRNDSLRALSYGLEKARADVRMCPGYPENRLLGMFFAVPRIPNTGEDSISITERLQRWIEKFPDVEADSYAYVFPKGTRHFCNEHFVYPGMALLIKEEKQSHQQSARPNAGFPDGLPRQHG